MSTIKQRRESRPALDFLTPDEAQVRDVNDGPMLVPRVRRESMSRSLVARERPQSGEIGTLLGQGDASRLPIVGLSFTRLVGEVARNGLPDWMGREAEAADGTGACRGYDDSSSRTRHAVPEGVLGGDGRMESFNDDPAIRYPDGAVVRDGGCEVAFKAGVTVEAGV